MELGRWQNLRTVRAYIDIALVELAELNLGKATVRLLVEPVEGYAAAFVKFCT